MNNKLVALLVLLVIIAGGFYVLRPQEAPERVGENPEGEADPDRMTLGMTTWVWQRATLSDGREIVPKNPRAFTLIFGDGHFSATTDCNSMSGPYSTDGDKIQFGDMISTLMFCDDSQETEFAQLLVHTDSYHFTNRGELVLDLKSDKGSIVFR